MLAISAMDSVTKNMKKHAMMVIQMDPAVPPFGKESTLLISATSQDEDNMTYVENQ